MKTPEEKKKAQAEAHRRWRQSEKGKLYMAAYRLKMKAKVNNDGPNADAVNAALTSQVSK